MKYHQLTYRVNFKVYLYISVFLLICLSIQQLQCGRLILLQTVTTDHHGINISINQRLFFSLIINFIKLSFSGPPYQHNYQNNKPSYKPPKYHENPVKKKQKQSIMTTMMQRFFGWIEIYSGWDFNVPPRYQWYNTRINYVIIKIPIKNTYYMTINNKYNNSSMT